jgi:hypothetical protein
LLKRKDRTQTGRKYMSVMYLAKDFSLEYVKNLQHSMVKKPTNQLENGQNINMYFTKEKL